MRTIAFLFAALAAACVCTAMSHDHALAAEEGANEGGAGAEGKPTVALPDWFNRQSREYFTLPPFDIPVIGASAVTRQITFLVTLQMMGVDNKEKVVSNRRQLQDIFFRDMYGVMAFRRPDDQSYNLDVIKTRLRRVGDQVVGPGVIDDIVVKTTYERNFNTSGR
jgi:hypothetical protein